MYEIFDKHTGAPVTNFKSLSAAAQWVGCMGGHFDIYDATTNERIDFLTATKATH